MGIILLKDVIIIFALSIAVLLFCHKMRIPSIVGFIFTGVLSGPHGLGLIRDIEAVDMLSNLGIMLLLFTVGMELSLKKIIQFKRYFVFGGVLQVLFTTLFGYALGMMMGRPPGESIFIGFLLSMSSTAIVLRLLEDRNETHSPQGQMVLGILIFQDVVAVPMMLMIPVLSGGEGSQHLDTFFFWLIAKGLLLLGIVFVCAEKIVPKLLYYITKTRSRELFLMTVLTLCFSVAYLAYALDLSLTIGAFLAGLIVSESEYSNEAIGDILPIQDIFTSFFFVSIGMLLDVSFVASQPFFLIMAAVGIIALKGIAASATGMAIGMPLRSAILGGLALSQIGEFSFVLAKSGIEFGMGNDYYYQMFLAVSLFTMALAPLIISYSPTLAHLAQKLPFPSKLISGLRPLNIAKENVKTDHVIVIGFGVSGKNLAHSLKDAQIPYSVLELNPDTVRKERAKGEPIYFGDATHPHVLNYVNISEASGVAVLINDPKAAYRIVETVRKMSSKVYIVVRVRFMQELEAVYKLGADDVIPDEFGTSVEIFSRVLRHFKIPTNEIEKLVASLRFENYEMVRHMYKEPTLLSDVKLNLEEVKIQTRTVHPDSPLVGKTISASGLRKEHGVSVILIKRGEEKITHFGGDTVLNASDQLTIVGPYDNIVSALNLFKPAEKHETSAAHNLAESTN